MREPYLSEFRRLVQSGAGTQDVHDSNEAAGFAITAPITDDAFLRREIERVALHQRSLCPILEAEVGQVNRILDVGCSTGGTTVALALSAGLAASEVIGVDPNTLSVAAAKVRAQGYDLSPDRVRFLPISADQPLPFEDGYFDCTVSVSVLEFISTAEAREAFARELQRVTKPNGFLFLATPSPFRLREYHSRRWFGDYCRKLGFPWASAPRQIRRMFSSCRPLSLGRHYHKKAQAKLGRVVSWLPAGVVSPLIAIAAPWQRFLFQKCPPE